MKKFFTLIAMAIMAVSVNAQTISWGKDDACDKGAAAESYADGELVLTCTDTANEKHQVDKNSAYFGTADNYVQYTYRFKTNGKSNSKNGLKLSVPAAGTLKIAVRTATSSDETRTLILTQNGTEIYKDFLKDSNSEEVTIGEEKKTVYHYVTVDVEKGDIDITYPINAINFYAFILEIDPEPTPDPDDPTGVSSVKAEKSNAASYNLGGQQVKSGAKGLVIKNGKKIAQ